MGKLLHCKAGSAAVEMVLVMPILLLLLFGSVEMGNYFLSEHVVQKGVRDAARYAARVPLADLTDDDCALSTDPILDQIRNVARTGDPDAAEDRLYFWTDSDSVTLEVDCPTGSYSTGGVYADFPDGSPVVTVSASVAYPALFDFLPFIGDGLQLNARSQAAVFGA